MNTYGAETYGERIADVYDELYSGHDPAAIVALNRLARSGRALELGIGTGRVALPLQETGVEVHGIDASPAMVERLRAKPGGENIPVTLGDFSEVAVEGRYTLIYVMFNTFYSLLTQEAQVRCFQNVARHLEPGGSFALEAFVPDLSRFSGGQTVQAVLVEDHQVQVDVSMHDPVRQQITSQHVFLAEGGVRLYPVRLRYAWPAELDLMARLAGLGLKHRWADWEGSAFSARSGMHVSVYEQAGDV
ncbi:MAG: class I SAM-dependent methyltransferase [Anaerolineaceae bacterium]|nr:class I SAM-dependent methyltransferase [Anaerolineaceae bacterium]